MLQHDQVQEEHNVEDYEVLTDEGWSDIESVIKTEPLDSCEIELHDGKSLTCATDHIVKTTDGDKYAKHLNTDDKVITEDDDSYVKSVKDNDKKEEMYDLVLEDESTHHYYTNGILSHNSTASDIFHLWTILFKEGKNIAILANKAARSKTRLAAIKLAYEKLPPWMKPGVKSWQATFCEFSNQNRIFTGATTENALAGEAVSNLFLDEFGRVPPNIQEEFWAANYPTVSEGGNIIIVSTPMGAGDKFHEVWLGANKDSNSFTPVRADWWEHPDRDEEWKEKTIEDIGEVKFNREYGLDFIGSVNTLVDSSKLSQLSPQKAKTVEKGGELRIYQKPMEGHIYAAGVDVSLGVKKNYSVAQIIDVTDKPYFQSAVYRTNKKSPRDFSRLLGGEANNGELVKDGLLQRYNDATAIVENNSMGEEVVSYLKYDVEYENLFDESKTRSGKRSTTKSKKQSLSKLKTDMEANNYILFDKATILELTGFIQISKRKFGVRGGKTDDCVRALAWVSYLLNSEYWIDRKDILLKIAREEEVEQRDRSFIGSQMPLYFQQGGTKQQRIENERRRLNDILSSS